MLISSFSAGSSVSVGVASNVPVGAALSAAEIPAEASATDSVMVLVAAQPAMVSATAPASIHKAIFFVGIAPFQPQHYAHISAEVQRKGKEKRRIPKS
jgi:hypothetical protein